MQHAILRHGPMLLLRCYLLFEELEHHDRAQACWNELGDVDRRADPCRERLSNGRRMFRRMQKRAERCGALWKRSWPEPNRRACAPSCATALSGSCTCGGTFSPASTIVA